MPPCSFAHQIVELGARTKLTGIESEIEVQTRWVFTLGSIWEGSAGAEASIFAAGFAGSLLQAEPERLSVMTRKAKGIKRL